MPVEFDAHELDRLESNLARCESGTDAAISMKLRSLLAGLCVSRGEKNGRAWEIEIPDTVYGMLTTGGLLKYYRRGERIVVRYEPAAITARVADTKLLESLQSIER